MLRAACKLLYERGLGTDAVADEVPIEVLAAGATAFLRNDPKAGMDLLWETTRFPEGCRCGFSRKLHDAGFDLVTELKWLFGALYETESQCKFWYGGVVPDDWAELGRVLASTPYARRVSSPLRMSDVTLEAVKSRYGEFGAYRHHVDACTMADWVAHDSTRRLTSRHRFPITNVDSVGPRSPLIAYNRTVKSRTVQRPCAILWPLGYHVDVARHGLKDRQPFREKLDKVAFRGAPSGVREHDPVSGRTSRSSVVDRWRDRPWADLDMTHAYTHAYTHTHAPSNTRNKMSQSELMRHKYVLCIEGADVSTAFGWALASNCVPVHPFPFVYEVWYFNGLEPWVHFVPTRQDAEDLGDAYLWCASHQEECEAIARRGREHMSRLLDEGTLSDIKRAVVARWDFRDEHVVPARG